MADSVEDLIDSSGNPVIDTILQYGLFVGAIFQLVCIFAVIFLPSKDSTEEGDVEEDDDPVSLDAKAVPPKQPTETSHTHSKSRRQEKKKKR